MRTSCSIILLSLTLTLPSFSQPQASQETKTTASSASNTQAPSKALMDAIWAAWSTDNPANVAKYYARGPHVFFDIAPLKYNSWAEYQKGVTEVIGGFQSLKGTVNDDAQIHRHGNLVWGTATIHHVDVAKDGKKSEGDFRWTVIWEKTGPEWLIVHEHVSAPLGAQ